MRSYRVQPRGSFNDGPTVTKLTTTTPNKKVLAFLLSSYKLIAIHSRISACLRWRRKCQPNPTCKTPPKTLSSLLPPPVSEEKLKQPDRHWHLALSREVRAASARASTEEKGGGGKVLVLSLRTKVYACIAITPSLRAVMGNNIHARYYLPLSTKEQLYTKKMRRNRWQVWKRTHKASEFLFAETTEKSTTRGQSIRRKPDNKPNPKPPKHVLIIPAPPTVRTQPLGELLSPPVLLPVASVFPTFVWFEWNLSKDGWCKMTPLAARTSPAGTISQPNQPKPWLTAFSRAHPSLSHPSIYSPRRHCQQRRSPKDILAPNQFATFPQRKMHRYARPPTILTDTPPPPYSRPLATQQRPPTSTSEFVAICTRS